MISRLANYEILHELKSGGMGAVLLARRRGPGAYEQLVAIKTIRPEYANAPSVRAMFLDEAAILVRLNHPGIAHVHDFGEEAGTLYMVMEYVAGISLRDLPPPPPLIVARAIAEAARGLHAAHEARDLSGTSLGLVHRDISPDNLLLGYDGHVKVIDFGIALIKNRQAPVTEFGTVKGKPPYMSPEQVKNEPMDRRSDVFSLAVVAWELLAHRNLFEGDSIYAIAIAVQQQALVPPSRVRGEELPLGLDAAIMNALDRNPDTRTATAAAFADSLEQVLSVGGAESLAAWTDRILAKEREAHRVWLASVVAGQSLPKAVGRGSAQVTEVAVDVGRAQTAAAPVAGGAAAAPAGSEPRAAAPPAKLDAVAPIIQTEIPTDEPSPSTSIGGTAWSSLDRVPRRSLAPLVIILLLLLAGGTVAFMTLRGHDAPAPKDARIADAALAIDAARVDAAIVAPPPDAEAPPADAAVVADAGHHHAPSDAHLAAHADAAVAMTVDAAIAVPAGSGFITIKFKGGVYKNITLDGKSVTPPLFHVKIAVGTHKVVFADPASGNVTDEQTMTVHDGEAVTVVER